MDLRRLALAGFCAAALAGCAASRDFHGYVPDQALPTDVKAGVDTRSTVLARLGTPSTTSAFDKDAKGSAVASGKERLWVYMSSTRELLTFYYPKVVQREIVAIQFDPDDVVTDVVVYDVDDGRVLQYNSNVTPTRGRELGILEQLFGTIGSLRNQLPGQNQDNRQPGENPGRPN
ncbi:MAG TPA: outer membrane protein assembly factor BamE [Hyphomonadaceae bacterium]|nr:outer membrane protein assembly factor BamE [Hyphomonadaceae bacterium]